MPLAGGGQRARGAFFRPGERGGRAAMRVRIDSNCESSGKGRVRPNAVPDRRGRRARRHSVRRGVGAERKKRRKARKVGVKHDGRRVAEIVTVQFKRLPGEVPMPADLKLHDGTAAKTAACGGSGTSRGRRRGGAKDSRGMPRRAPPGAVGPSESRQVANYETPSARDLTYILPSSILAHVVQQGFRRCVGSVLRGLRRR